MRIRKDTLLNPLPNGSVGSGRRDSFEFDFCHLAKKLIQTVVIDSSVAIVYHGWHMHEGGTGSQ